MIQRDIEVNSQDGIHEGMHEHLNVDKCDVPIVAKCRAFSALKPRMVSTKVMAIATASTLFLTIKVL